MVQFWTSAWSYLIGTRCFESEPKREIGVECKRAVVSVHSELWLVIFGINNYGLLNVYYVAALCRVLKALHGFFC